MAGELIAVVPYDPQWPHRFEAERVLMERVLAPWLEGGVHHIGATSIPGLAAKPIIDMMAGVRAFEEARAAFDPLREQSYVYAPHRPGIAHHFSKPSPRPSQMTHGLHLTEPGSDLWRERLAFRDALRADPALAAEYEALKLRARSGTPRGCRRVHGRQARLRRPRSGERGDSVGPALTLLQGARCEANFT